MIARKFRLSRADFPKPTERRKKWVGLVLQIYTIERNNERSPRLGVVVSKKTLKGAKMRNTLKRRIYESVQTFLPALPRGEILLIFPIRRATTISYKELERDIKDYFTQRGGG